MQLTEEHIQILAQDAASLAAGRQLAAPRHWKELGHTDAVLWGVCQGSADYQVRVDRADLGSKCSCPSRRIPCKHVLALIILHLQNETAIPEDEPPDWVHDWLTKHHSKAKVATAAGGSTPANEAAQRKRQAQREAKIQAGLERLELWLTDLVRQGLAGLECRPREFWEEPARRLVDAQAPGLAARVERLPELIASTPDWPSRLLEELGKLQLLIRAYRRQDELPDGLRQDVRQLVGWNLSVQDLQTSGELVEDDWAVIGQWVDEGDRLRTQRNWCVGLHTGRPALILQFAPGMQPFAERITVGLVQPGQLRFYPSAWPVRARFETRSDFESPIPRRLRGQATVVDWFALLATALAQLPWLGPLVCVLHEMHIVVDQQQWYLRDHTGHALPLLGSQHWKLLALTGGQPTDLAGEWNGHALRLLGIWLNGEYRPVV